MIGSQEPRIRVEPHRVLTDGSDAALLMQAYGYELDPWQKDIVECWLGKDELGRYTVTSAGLSVPRQNGKNECLIGREFYGMAISGEKSVLRRGMKEEWLINCRSNPMTRDMTKD